MFATYDLTLFPTVIVRFNGNIKTDNDFNSFTQSWLDLYTNKQDYSFIFDTTNMGVPHIKYSFKMTYFIRDLRKREYQYLQKSIIIVKNNFIQYLLDLIFFIQSPVAPVYIIKNELNVKKILNNEEIEECKIINP